MVLSVQNDQHLMIKADVSACMGERGGKWGGGRGGREWAGGGGGGRQKDERNYVSKHDIIYKVHVLCICYIVSNSALFNPLYVGILF